MAGPRAQLSQARTRPTLLAVDADPMQLDRIESALQRNFGSDFRVRGELTAAAGLEVLKTAHALQQHVALVLVDRAIQEAQRCELFARARILHPDARRALLIEWGAWADRSTATAILTAMAVGDLKPRDE